MQRRKRLNTKNHVLKYFKQREGPLKESVERISQRDPKRECHLTHFLLSLQPKQSIAAEKTLSAEVGDRRGIAVGIYGLGLLALSRCDNEAARTHMGEEGFAAAWAEGKAMTLEQALAARYTLEHYL